MVESGITVGGVPLEEHILDKERKKFYADTLAEIEGQKKLTYKSRNVIMEIQYSKRSSAVRHLTIQEYFMKENIERCKSGPEYILTIFQDGLPQTVISLIERFEHWEIEIGPSGVRQAFYKLLKQHPDLFETAKNEEKKTIYTMLPAVCQLKHEDLMKLWRKHITWHVLLEQNPTLKRALTSKALDSEEAPQQSIGDLLKKMDGVIKSLAEWQITVANISTRLDRVEHAKVRGADKVPNHGVLDVNVNLSFGRKEV
jgi:hypothetical protein